MRNKVKMQLSAKTNEEAVETLNSLLEPLLGLMLDVGVTVPQINETIRQSAVSVAMKRVVNASGRENKSRAAIITGLPRSEVTRILSLRTTNGASKRRKPTASRVISGWFEDPTFLGHDGSPAVLPIFGGKSSFQGLVEKYGGGIPVRAMLDELSQKNALELLKNQRAKVKGREPATTGIRSKAIAAMAKRGRDIMETLVYNARNPALPHFEASASTILGDFDTASLVRGKITSRGRDFIKQASALLKHHSNNRVANLRQESNLYRVGVAILYFQQELNSGSSKAVTTPRPRKNLKRKLRVAR
jgi:hypothetical protein